MLTDAHGKPLHKLEKAEETKQPEQAFDPGAPIGAIMIQVGMTPLGFAMMQKLMDKQQMPEPGLVGTRGFLKELERIYTESFGGPMNDAAEIKAQFEKFKEAQEAEMRKRQIMHPGGAPVGPGMPPPPIGGR